MSTQQFDTREQWLDERRKGLGASDVPALLGLSTFQSPWSLWASKVGLLPDTETTERQQLGLDLEAVIAGRFRRVTGLVVAGEQSFCTHPEKPWARATVDGFVCESAPGANSLDDAIGVAEWKSDGGLGTWRKDGIPARVQAQVQWQMYVTGTPEAWIGVFHSGFRFEVYQLHRDERDIDFMVARAERFWTDYVLTGDPPPVDGSDATAAAIGAVWPQHDPGKTVELDGELVADIGYRNTLKARMKDDKKALATVDNRLKHAIGDAEVATARGVPILTLRAQERTDINADGLRLAHPEIAEQFTTTTTFRVLRAAPKATNKKAAEAA